MFTTLVSQTSSPLHMSRRDGRVDHRLLMLQAPSSLVSVILQMKNRQKQRGIA